MPYVKKTNTNKNKNKKTNIKEPSEMRMVDHYFELIKKYEPDYPNNQFILMYQNGKFFEIYSYKDDGGNYYPSSTADFLRITHCNINSKHCQYEGKEVLMCGPQIESLYQDRYIQLVESGLDLIVYKQIDVEIVKSNGEKAIKKQRVYDQTITRGSLLSMDQNVLSTKTACMWIEPIKSYLDRKQYLYIGLSVIDTHTGDVNIHQYKSLFNHIPRTYDEAEKFFSIHQPKELLFLTPFDEKKTSDILNYCSIPSSTNVRRFDLKQMKSTSFDKSTHRFVQAFKKSEKENFRQEFFHSIYKNHHEYTNPSEFFTRYREYFIGMQSLCYMLLYIKENNKTLVSNISMPVYEGLDEYMFLANHSLKQLHIISDNKEHGKNSSISDYLNHCLTASGKRYFYEKMVRPTTNIEELNNMYDLIEYVGTLKHGYGSNDEDTIKKPKPFLYQVFRKQLSHIYDLPRLMRLNQQFKTPWKNFSLLYENLSFIKNIIGCIQKDTTFFTKVCDYGFEDVWNYSREIQATIEKTCNIDHLTYFSDVKIDKIVDNHLDHLMDIYPIQRGFSEKADHYLKEIIDVNDRLESIRQALDNLVCQFDGKKNAKNYISIENNKNSAMQFLITEKRSTIFKQALQHYKTHKKSSTLFCEYISKYDGKKVTEFFNLDEIDIIGSGKKNKKEITCSKIKEIVTSIQDNKELLIKEWSTIHHTLMETFNSYHHKINKISEFVSFIDYLQCNCYNVKKYNLCKPVIRTNHTTSSSATTSSSTTASSYVNIKGLRHLLAQEFVKDVAYVTNDFSIGGENEMTGFLLYGTNGVGKTTLVRATGIAIVLAQAGMYVPCSSFVYAPYKKLFTRILGNDNLFQGLSTFQVELSELGTILEKYDEHSIVLGDELCSGTDTKSALTICSASLETLCQKNTSFVFATHFHELAQYKRLQDISGLQYKHMSVEHLPDNSLRYDRILKDGPGNALYGIEVCKASYLPDTFLEKIRIIKNELFPEEKELIDYKGSSYNSDKLVGGMCELCNQQPVEDTHHMVYQEDANENEYIQNEVMSMHKNHKSNLMNVCKYCHQTIHKKNKRFRRIKTSVGTIVEEL